MSDRNIVMLTLDALRADHCSFLGYDRETTPTIDKLAQNGIYYENAVSPSAVTPASMSGIFRGQYTEQNIDYSHASNWRAELNRHITLAKALKQQGYSTVAVHPQVHASKYFGFDNGFDRFIDFLPDIESNSAYSSILQNTFEQNKYFSLIRNAQAVLRQEEAVKPWEKYYDTIVETLDDVSEPFFLWVILPDTHFPYLPPRSHREWSNIVDVIQQNYNCYRNIGKRGINISEKTRQAMIDVYDDTIKYSDAFIESLMDDLNDEDPIYVIHADHGEAFGEHGFYGHQPFLYDEVIRVPWVIGNINLNHSVSEPVSLTNLPSTLFDLLELESDPFFGESVLREGSSWAVSKAYESDDRRIAIRLRDWKFIVTEDGEELYNIELDPNEKEDLSYKHPDLLEQFRKIDRLNIQDETEKKTISNAISRLADQV